MTVVITKPTSGATLTGLTTVEATYNGQNFDIATVTVDGQQLGSDSSQPISFALDTTKVADGPHTLTVAVRYRTSQGVLRWQKASIPITTEGNDMKVTLTSDKGTTDVSGTVVVTATIDPAREATTPVSCKWYVDKTLVSTDTTYPLTFSWNTTAYTDGSHTIKADVLVGGRTRLDALPFTVKNLASPPPPPPPPPGGVPVNINPPTISGTATEGQTLAIKELTSDWTNTPTSYTHQWSRCDSSGNNPVPISSAVGNRYTLSSADVGSTIRCWTTAFNSFGPSSPPLLSAQTAVVTALSGGAPVLITAPAISGNPLVGQTLTISNGTWSINPTSYTHQWLLCDSTGENCTSPAGEEGTSYLLTSAALGKRIRCWTTAFNGATGSTPVRSAATAAVTGPPPTGLSVDRATMRAIGGSIKRDDSGLSADPTPGLWGEIVAVDPSRHQWISSGGDTRPRADGSAQSSAAFRRMTVQKGDDFYGQRAALGRNWYPNGENTGTRTDGTFALAYEGDRKITFLSIRFPTSFDMTTFAWQQIFEWKQAQPYDQSQMAWRDPGTHSVAVEVQLYAGNLRVHVWGNEYITLPAPPKNVWIRFALDITFTQQTNGKVTLYADVDNDGNWSAASNMGTWTGATMMYATGSSPNNSLVAGQSIPCFLEMGPYQNAVFATTTVDYDNVQVVSL